MKKPEFFSLQVDESAYYYLDLTDHSDKSLSIVCGGWERCRPDYVMKRSTFLYNAIEFIADGKGTLEIGGQTVPLVPGMVFSYRPGVPHMINNDPDEPLTKYFIDFTGTEADQIVNRTSLSAGPIQVSEPARIRKLFDEIQETADNPAPSDAEACILLLRLLLLKIDSLAAHTPFAHSRSMQSYQKCRKHVDAAYMTLNSLDDVARECHMDCATICRLFKRFNDCTPYQYLMMVRMRHAADRLQNSSLLIKEVADEMGFDDPYHFSRSFKRVHGISPQRFLQLTSRMPLS